MEVDAKEKLWKSVTAVEIWGPLMTKKKLIYSNQGKKILIRV